MVVVAVRPDAAVIHANTASEPLRFVFGDDAPASVRVTDLEGVSVSLEALPRARAGRGEAFSELRLLWHLPGGKRCIAAHAAPIAGGFRGAPAMALSLEDRTSQVELEDSLREATAGRNELMAIAAHELRSPLSTLQLLVQRLWRSVERDGDLPPDELVKRLAVMRRQTDRINVLVQNLLDVDLRRLDLAALDLEPFDLCELVRDVVERWSEHAHLAGCEVELRDHEPLVGSWDRLRLEQVLTNLLSNAVKYGAGTPVEISVEARAGASRRVARLVVADRGVGVPEEHRDRIFDRYHRVHSTGRVKGLGLGLYIVREIVEAHGGTIRYEARPGGGSMFIVELPISGSGDTAGLAPAERGSGGRSSG